jgi:hypothetical protein
MTSNRPAAMLMPLACLSLVVCLVARAQADSYITDVVIQTQQTATNGIADSAGYQQVFTVDGSGIQSISITTPGPNNQSYNLAPDTQAAHWEYDSQRYISLTALRGDYPTGSYTLNISYAGGTDTVTLPFSPTQPTPTSWFIQPEYPTAISGVLAGPTLLFTWPLVSGGNISADGSGVSADLEYPNDIKIAQSGVLPIGATSWQPSAILAANTQYEFQLGVYNEDPNSGPWQTNNHSSFTYYGVFGNVDNTRFTTVVPEPGTFFLLAAGGAAWWLWRRLRRIAA